MNQLVSLPRGACSMSGISSREDILRLSDEMGRRFRLCLDKRRRRGKLPPTPEEIKALRSRLGLSQAAFCQRYDLNLTNYQKWEQDRAKPFGSAITILRMMLQANG